MTISETVRNFLESFFQESGNFLKNGDYQSAIKAITETINLAEKSKYDLIGYYYFYRADIFYELKNFSSAEKDYKKAIKLLGRYEEYECGVANFRLKNYSAAVKCFQSAIQNDIGSAVEYKIISPCEIKSLGCWCYSNCSKIYTQDKKGFYETHFELCPFNLVTDLVIEECGYHSGTLKINSNLKLDDNSLKNYNLEELLNYLTKLIEKNPNSIETAEIYNLRGQIYFDFRNYLPKIDINIPENFSEDEFEIKCYKATAIEEYYKNLAVEDFNKATNLKPDCLRAYMNWGWFYFCTERYEISIENYSAALKICPYNPVAYYYRAHSYENLGNYRQALKEYEKAYKCDTGVSFYLHKVWLMRAKIAYIAELKESVKKFNRFIKKHPDNFKGYFKRGKCYQELQEYELAVEDFTTAIKLSPNNFRAYFRRSECYHFLEEWKCKDDDNFIAQKLIRQAPEVAKYTKIIENYFEYSYQDIAEAYCKRGKIYESWGYDKLAQADFNSAKKYGYKE